MTMGFLPPLLQSSVLMVAPSKFRDLSTAIYSSAFNIGIGGGALVGGLMLTHLGIMSLPTFFLSGMAIALVVARAARRMLEAGRERVAEGAA